MTTTSRHSGCRYGLTGRRPERKGGNEEVFTAISKTKSNAGNEMKALTICQPYAELIMRGEKLVENRRWPTNYRGPLLIHAGKSREWLELDDKGAADEMYEIPLNEMNFGAVVGIAQLRGCISFWRDRPVDPVVLEAWPWFAGHKHTEGPWCWILERARRFSRPFPYRGQQGLFDIPVILSEHGLQADPRYARNA
jgi:hypothetical protein